MNQKYWGNYKNIDVSSVINCFPEGCSPKFTTWHAGGCSIIWMTTQVDLVWYSGYILFLSKLSPQHDSVCIFVCWLQKRFKQNVNTFFLQHIFSMQVKKTTKFTKKNKNSITWSNKVQVKQNIPCSYLSNYYAWYYCNKFVFWAINVGRTKLEKTTGHWN